MGIVTYKKDDQSVISTYDGSSSDHISTLHKGDIRKQLAEHFRNKIKVSDLNNITDNTLGYILQDLPKFYSRISNIEFHSDKTFRDFNITNIDLK